MLKYHHYDSETEPVEIRVNGAKIEVEDKLGREFIDRMRNCYFALFDLISLTDMDQIKKKLMKNKIKSIVIDIWAKLIQGYAKDKDTRVFTESLSANGLILSSLESFVGFAFSDEKSQGYFTTEALKIFNNNIHELSVLK